MLSRGSLTPILDDDAIVRGLGDSEARLLIEWLVEQAETLADSYEHDRLQRRIDKLCSRARAISRFVQLWNIPESRGSALQLAAVERFSWPLPSESVDSWQLLSDALIWEKEAVQDSMNSK